MDPADVTEKKEKKGSAVISRFYHQAPAVQHHTQRECVLQLLLDGLEMDDTI